MFTDIIEIILDLSPGLPRHLNHWEWLATANQYCL